MSFRTCWPAFDVGYEWPCRWRVEQAIWGKAHRQASDFRWLGASSGFPKAGLGSVLGLGAEDRPVRCCFWRGRDVGGGAKRDLAIVAYPSRAVDAAGRAGFLERRVYAWRPVAGVPTALAAAVVLRALVAAATDGDAAITAGAWGRPDYCPPLGGVTIDIPESSALAWLEEGRRSLLEAVDAGALEAFYSDVCAGRRPAVLTCERPLPGGALAALLLPIPAAEAASLSLAGWVPSSRFQLPALGEQWGMVTTSDDRAGKLDRSAAAREDRSRAVAWARALTLGQPSSVERGGASAVVHVAPSGDGPWSQPVFEPGPAAAGSAEPMARWRSTVAAFAADADARWLDASTFDPGLPLDPSSAEVLVGQWTAVAEGMPAGADLWQWLVKLDVLGAVLVAVAPASSGAGEVSFDSDKVSPLHFVEALADHAKEEWLRACPASRLETWRHRGERIQKRRGPAPRFQGEES
ncbi:MAG: hypothetical protein AAFY88_04220 [Acidobacteriota bacterium]